MSWDHKSNFYEKENERERERLVLENGTTMGKSNCFSFSFGSLCGLVNGNRTQIGKCDYSGTLH